LVKKIPNPNWPPKLKEIGGRNSGDQTFLPKSQKRALRGYMEKPNTKG